jgi:hypothetical protein
MKLATLIISIAVFIWLLAAMGYAFGRQIPPLLVGYLLLYAISSVCAQIILGRTAGNSSEYLARYIALLLPVVVIGAVLAAQWCWSARVLTAALIASLTCGTMLWHVANSRLELAWRMAVPAQVDWTVFFAAAFSALGVLAFVGVLVAADQKQEIVRMALCAHWTLYGAFLFAYSTGILRDRGAWIQRGAWMSAVIGIAAYAWMAWQLSGAQMELSRQGTAQVCMDERAAVAVAIERRGQ